MKVLVTGATGFVGHAVLERLLSSPHEVIALRRNPAPQTARAADSRSGASVSWRVGNVLDADSLVTAMQGVDAVIHLVGIISESRRVTFRDLHVKATENVLEAMKRAGVRRVVHMSALGTRPNAVSEYHRSKWAAEERVLQRGAAWTIFRPSLIYGPEDHFVNMFRRMLNFSPVLPVIGKGTAKFAPVHVTQVAEAFVKALTAPESAGKVFDLCGPEQFTMPEILRAVMKAAGKKRTIVRLPLWMAWAQAVVLEFVLGRITGVPPPLNRGQIIMLEEGSIGDAAPADLLFGLQHRPFETCLREYA